MEAFEAAALQMTTEIETANKELSELSAVALATRVTGIPGTVLAVVKNILD